MSIESFSYNDEFEKKEWQDDKEYKNLLKEVKENIESNKKEKKSNEMDYVIQEIRRIRGLAEEVHKVDQLEADVILKLSLEGKDNFIDIIENKNEFELIRKLMGALLVDGGNHITEDEIKKIEEKGPKTLRDYLVLEYGKNPEKFKAMRDILDGINRNGLQNFFDKDTISFEEKVKYLKNKLEKEFGNVQHIPDSEKKLLDAIKKYYG